MWSDPGVKRVVLARLVSRIGGEAAFFVGIWGKTAFVLDADASGLALVMGALGVASLIGSAVAGVLVDRFDPRRVLMVGEVLFIPAALSLILAQTIPSMAVATFFLGLLGAPVYTAIASFAPFLTDDPDRLGRINALIEGASWAAFVIGPGLGALLTATVGIETIFVLDAVTSAVAALLVVPVRVRHMARTAGRRHGLRELKEGFVYAARSPRLRFYMGLGALVWVLFGNFTALEPLFYRDVLRVEPETLGWVNSLLGVGLVTGSIIANRLPSRWRNARFLVVLVAMNALGDLGYVGTDRLGVVVTAGMLWGVVLGVMAPLHRTMIQINTPEEMMGRITGANQILHEVGHLLPLVFAPALASALGVQPALMTAGVVMGLVTLAFYPTARRLDRTRGAEVPRPSALPEPNEPRSVGP